MPSFFQKLKAATGIKVKTPFALKRAGLKDTPSLASLKRRTGRFGAALLSRAPKRKIKLG